MIFLFEGKTPAERLRRTTPSMSGAASANEDAPPLAGGRGQATLGESLRPPEVRPSGQSEKGRGPGNDWEMDGGTSFLGGNVRAECTSQTRPWTLLSRGPDPPK